MTITNRKPVDSNTPAPNAFVASREQTDSCNERTTWMAEQWSWRSFGPVSRRHCRPLDDQHVHF
jgi:hypothetical protein